MSIILLRPDCAVACIYRNCIVQRSKFLNSDKIIALRVICFFLPINIVIQWELRIFILANLGQLTRELIRADIS